MSEKQLEGRLQQSFRGDWKLARDYLHSVGDITHIPHLQTVLLNLSVVSELLGQAVAPHAEGFRGVPVKHGVVSAKALLASMKELIERLQMSGKQVLQLLQELEVLAPIDAEQPDDLFIPSRLAEGKSPSQHLADSADFRREWLKAVQARRSKAAKLARRFQPKTVS